jgi:UDP-N-acetylmuramate: L-alanyl-gamma-D-glutamyl-meso-diaminopimelate ligase
MKLHILGICGTLMGSIALLARELGHDVTGTDENVYPPMSTQLEQAGISLSAGYTEDAVPADTELVIVGNANLPRGNPALESVLNRGIPYTSGAEWLGRHLLQDRWVIAIAGTHGKTTTSAMTAWILEQAGLKPGFLIGGIPLNFGQSSRLGETPFFVIEADEYDTSYFDRRSKFLHYRPRTLVLNNLEYDHADIFDSLEAIKQQFHLLLRSVPGEGLVIFPEDDEHVQDVLSRGCWTPTLAIGSSQLNAQPLNDDCSEFSVYINGDIQGTVKWNLSGRHNLENALSAIAAARHVGVAPPLAIEALSDFKSVKRRLEIIHQADQLTVYDDFAHHPTAIATTLLGLRHRVGDEQILAIIEPASHTMRQGTHENALSDSASAADHVIWYEPANVGWNMSNLVTTQSEIVSDMANLFDTVMKAVNNRKGPMHLLIMSNGSFSGLHQSLVDALTA